MKTNFKYVLLAAAALVLGFSSCSKDSDSKGDVVPNGEPTWASFKIVSDGKKAIETGATTSEKTLVDARVYVFTSTRTLEAIVDLTAAENGTKEVQVTSGTHYFLAVGNLAAATVPVFAEGATLANVKAGLLSTLTVAGLTVADNFLMTSPDLETTANLPVVAAGSATNVNIPIGRAVAKVNIEMAAQPTVDTYFNVVSGEFAIAQNVDKMFLFTNKTVEGYLYTPYYSEPVVSSPVTPELGDLLSTDYAATDGTAASAKYAIENSSNIGGKAIQQKSVVASISAQMTPAKWVVNGGTASAIVPAAGLDFWRVAFVKNDPTIPAPAIKVNPLVAYYEDIYSEEPDAAEITRLEVFIGTTPAFTGADKAVAIKYTAGTAYYNLFMGDHSEKNEIKKYTIQRNNYYYATITSVSTLGKNAANKIVDTTGEEILDPENPPVGPGVDPIDPEDTFIKATVTVADWTGVNFGVGI